jgi:hypothetical protein
MYFGVVDLTILEFRTLLLLVLYTVRAKRYAWHAHQLMPEFQTEKKKLLPAIG